MCIGYQASIPAADFAAGEMVRWYVEVSNCAITSHSFITSTHHVLVILTLAYFKPLIIQNVLALAPSIRTQESSSSAASTCSTKCVFLLEQVDRYLCFLPMFQTTDTAGNAAKDPPFVTGDWPQYYGTVIDDGSQGSSIPVMHW